MKKNVIGYTMYQQTRNIYFIRLKYTIKHATKIAKVTKH